MEYKKLVLAFATMSVATVFGAHTGFAQVEPEHHHHHMMESSNAAYQRSTASYEIPDIKLVDVNGAQRSLRDGLGSSKPVMLNFIFTTCTAICPVMSATFRNVQEALGEERSGVNIVSISIDPENDTPARLKAYAEKYHAGPQWQMLTGTIEDSIAVQRAFGVFRGDKMSHTPVTFLRAGGAKSPWVRLDGLVGANDIIKEYRALAR